MLIGTPHILQMLLSIRDGQITLPDIQRSFVWDVDQIYMFCDSFFRGYPFGSFLFWRVVGKNDPTQILVYRKFLEEYHDKIEMKPGLELAPGEEKLLVLDGQQRLQSSYLCFLGNYDGSDLYLDLMTGQHDYDKDHSLQYYVRFFKSAELGRFYSTLAGQGRKMVRIKDFIELPHEAMGQYAERKVKELGIEDEQFTARSRIHSVWNSLRDPNRIQLYTIDAQVHNLVEATSLTEVAEIFVRVNSGGTRLTRSDLISTLIRSRWIEAREEFQKLCDQLNSSGDFEVDTDFIIRALTVFTGRSARFDMERMRDENIMLAFKEIFPRAKAALQSTFDFLTQANGGAMQTYRLLSGGQRADRGYNVLLPIALYLYLRPTQEIPEDQRRRLRKYLYTAIFSRYMVVYVESHIDRLAREVRSSAESGSQGFPLLTVESAIKEWRSFDHISDFFNDSNALDPLLNILHGGRVAFKTLNDRNAPQRDHIFPRSKLERQGVLETEINHYANMRLLGAIANILKSDEDPVTALAAYSEERLAQDYLIPKAFLDYNMFGKFLDERTKLIKERVDQFLTD
jgi:hypothetical protein